MIHGSSLLDHTKLTMLHRLATECLTLPAGEYWECGVYKGGSAVLLADCIQSSGQNIRLRLFDTFEGHPYDDVKPYGHRKNGFSDTSYTAVLHSLSGFECAAIHRGVIPQSFEGFEAVQIRLAHLDLDLYQSTKDAIEFIWPRIMPGGIILEDDYYSPECGARQANDEYMATRPRTEYQQYHGSGTQSYFIKVK
jgi:O-methyltransferase